MATRFYLPSSGSAPSSPTIDAGVWEHINTARRAMSTAKANTAQQSTSYSPDAADHIANQDAHFVQFVSSERLAAQTINAQTVKLAAICSETNAGNNCFLTWRLLLERAGSIVGTILAIRRDGTECATSLTNRTDSATSSSLSCNDGDRLVLEVGLGGSPTAAGGVQGHNGAIQFGDNQSTDLPENDTDTGATKNPWLEFAENLTFLSDAPPPIQNARAALATIGAVWTLVTITPLFASVVLANTNDPTITHPSRQAESAAVVRALHPEPQWPAQTSRKLPVSLTAVPVDNPPFSSAKYRGEWPHTTWEAQARPKLVPIVPLAVDAPPVVNLETLYGPLASHYAPPTVMPLWTGTLTVEGQAASADNPPFTSKRYAGEWPPLEWAAQARPGLTPGNDISQPPPAGEKYTGEWPQATWEAQRRPKLVPIASAPVNDPPFSSAKYRGEWPHATWEAQARPKLVPIPPAAVDAPLVINLQALYGPLASHYAPPTVTPLWARTLTSEGVPVMPVDDPPFQMRHRQDQPVDLHWIPRALTAISLARQAESVDNPPPLEPRYRGEWPEATWGAQKRPTLVQPGAAVPVDTPPFSSAKYRGEWPHAMWEAQARPKLVPIVPSTVNDPPFSQAKYRGDWPHATWEAQRARQLPVSVTAVPVNNPPFSQAKYKGEWPAQTWEVQARPKLVPIPPAAVDAPPVINLQALYGPLASHYAPPTVTPLWARTLTSEGVPVTPVDDPPFQMRHRQDQPVELHWIPRALTAISLARQAESVDNPPPLEPRYRGEWPESTWTTQKRPTLVQPGAAVPVDTPPFSSAKYRGEWPHAMWEAQARPKLVPIVPSTVNDPPFSQAKYRGDWPHATWEAQRARQLPVSVTAVPVDTPPFSSAKYRGEWPHATWEAQARPKLVPIPPHVPMAVRVRAVVGAVPMLGHVDGRMARVARVSGGVPTLSDVEGA